MKCYRCSTEKPVEDCPYCKDWESIQELRKCWKCGQENYSHAEVCVWCGASKQRPQIEDTLKVYTIDDYEKSTYAERERYHRWLKKVRAEDKKQISREYRRKYNKIYNNRRKKEKEGNGNV